MREKTIKLYEFDELSEEVQEKIIEKFWDINVDYEWYDYLIDNFKHIGKILGIDIDNIYFSGFYNQGDGLCFVGNYQYNKNSVKEIKQNYPKEKELQDIAETLFKLQKKYFYNLATSIEKTSYRYDYEDTVSIEVYNYETGNEVEDEITNDTITECFKDLMRYFYNILKKDYEYLISRKAIIETIEANEFEFLGDGRIY